MKRIKFLLRRVKHSKIFICVSMMFFAFSSIINLYATYLTLIIVDQGIAQKNMSVLMIYSLLMLLCQVLTIAVGTIGLYISEKGAHKILSNYKMNMIDQLFQCSVSQYYSYGETEIRVMLTSTIDNLKFYFADLPRVFVEIAVLILGSLIYVSQVNIIIVFLIIVIILVNSITYLVTKKALFTLSDKKLQQNKEWTEFLKIICKSIDEFIINAGKGNLYRVIDVKHTALCKLDIQTKRIQVASSFISNIFTQSLTLGTYIILQNKVSIGVILATISFSGIIFPLIQTCYEMLGYCIDLQPCIDEAMKLEHFLVEEENMIAAKKDTSNHFYVKHLFFDYGEKEIYRDFNLEFQKTGLYVCIDSNGSGKTTFFRAIMKTYPVKSGSTNITEDLCEYLLQKNIILPGNIVFNLTLTDKNEIDENKMWKIFDMLELSNVIRKRKEGVSFMLDFHENGFSGGELRKLCLARTLYQGEEKPIWILDEPDAGLDQETIKRLGEYLVEMSKRKLIILVTHNEYLSSLGTKIILGKAT